MTDTEIIDLYWSRSEDAIGFTDAAYGRRLGSLANRILDNRSDSEEVVNDTYLKTWNTIPQLRPQFLYAYLAAICRNLALNLLDWNQAAKRKAEIVPITEELALCIPDTSQENTLRGREIGKALDGFLAGLPKESRMIFLRRYWYAEAVADIAKRYGMTESKVKMQLLRTREKLRDYLKREEIAI